MKIKETYSNKALQEMLFAAFEYSCHLSHALEDDNQDAAVKSCLRLEDQLLKIFEYVMEEENGV